MVTRFSFVRPLNKVRDRQSIDAAVVEASRREELRRIVVAYRHLREEHRRAGPEGHTRRRLETQLDAHTDRFERVLEDPAMDEAARRGWRDHLYRGAPEPGEGPVPAVPRVRPRRPRRPLRWRRQGRAPLWRR